MTEGRVFVCSWKREGDRYRVWVKRRPKVRAEGATFDEADEALWGAIMDATGDGENTHEYDPPAPSDASRRGQAVRLVSLGANSSARILEPELLYSGGFCPECLKARGERTDAPLTLDGIESGVDAGFTKIKGSFGGPLAHFFSDRFLALLTEEERARFEWRPVVRARRGRKAFFELAGSRVNVLVAAHAKLRPFSELWRCGTCSWMATPHYHSVARPNAPFAYLAASSLPAPIPSCFTIGRAPDLQLCFTRARWRELVGRSGTKACKSSELGVLAPEEVDPSPTYRPRAEVWAESEAKAAMIRAEYEARRLAEYGPR